MTGYRRYRTKAEQKILVEKAMKLYDENEDMNFKAVAERLGISPLYLSELRRRFVYPPVKRRAYSP